MKTILIFSLFFAPLSLANDTQIEVDQLWQEYAEPSMQDEFLTETEAESRKSAPAREPELTRALLAHWESIMQQRRRCDGTYHWDGDRAYGAISYRTQDLPHEMVQQLHAYRNKAEELSEEEKNRLHELRIRKQAYINSAPDAEKIDSIIRHIHREEYPQAIKQLAQLRHEHPDYCPQAFNDLAAALTTPKRLELLLLCTKLPLGVIRETHTHITK